MPKIVSPKPNVGTIQCTDGRAVHAVVLVRRSCRNISEQRELTKDEKADADDRACEQARQQMVFELSESTVHHTRKASIFEVDAVDDECKKAGWCDNEEHEARALS